MNVASGPNDDSHRSLSGEAREWITRLPADTWFHTTAVPGPRHIVRNVLSRLMAADLPIIGRVTRGVYWRQPPPASPRYGKVPGSTHAADSLLVPPGSSLADFCALRLLGWTSQMPYRTSFAVPYRNLTPHEDLARPQVRFFERSNIRRRSLNWNEANLLEAVRAAGGADYPTWDYAMLRLTEMNGWMKRGEPIRKEMLLWAAETESPGRKWPNGTDGCKSFDAVIGRLANDLPDVVGAP